MLPLFLLRLENIVDSNFFPDCLRNVLRTFTSICMMFFSGKERSTCPLHPPSICQTNVLFWGGPCFVEAVFVLHDFSNLNYGFFSIFIRSFYPEAFTHSFPLIGQASRKRNTMSYSSSCFWQLVRHILDAQ